MPPNRLQWLNGRVQEQFLNFQISLDGDLVLPVLVGKTAAARVRKKAGLA